MPLRFVGSDWRNVFYQALSDSDGTSIRIICPFIKLSVVQRMLKTRSSTSIQVITRFNLKEFSQGVSDVSALRLLFENGADIRGIKHLHTKLYCFGKSTVILTSANLTEAALSRNHEFGILATDIGIAGQSHSYFGDLWNQAGRNLSLIQLSSWESKLEGFMAAGTRPSVIAELGDDGIDIGLPQEPDGLKESQGTAGQAFVKFFGEGSNRAHPSMTVLDEIVRSGCHWACPYPKGKRPRQVRDGAVMFMGRLSASPNDTLIFGQAVGLAHVPGRDDANDADIKRRKWKSAWPHYVRVRNGMYIAGTISNGVSLNELMEKLGSDAFVSTQRNAMKGTGNTDPRHAYRQQPSVALTTQATEWLSSKMEVSFARYGKILPSELERLDWPDNMDQRLTGLSQRGARLLRFLVAQIRSGSVPIGNTALYPTYKDAVRAVGVTPVSGQGLGRQFEREGGLALNSWLRDQHLPALTGLVVRRDTERPGDTYFTENGHSPDDVTWWHRQIRRAVAFDWSQYVR